jgi:integrase
MASISKTKSGTTEIYFVGTGGTRRKLSLERATRKQAESTRLRIEQLVQDKRLGTPHDTGLTEWIRALNAPMRMKLARVGLLEAAPATLTLSHLIERFMRARTVKAGTMATYKQCTDSLLLHLGADTPIDKISPADAEEWRASIAKAGRVREKKGPRSLARATVAKRTNIAKAIFSKAKVWKLLASSPFEHIKSGSQSNPDRARYISKDETQKILDACPSIQWRALIGIARYAGQRCPSEIRELKWSDLDWKQKALTVRSPKTAANSNHAVRIVPASSELQPILLELFEAAEECAVEMVPQAHRANVNITHGLRRIIERAGLKPWPRLIQNLRASCATDWAGERPLHEASKWLGHSVIVSAKHYLQPNDLHFKAVTGTSQWLGSTTKTSDALGAESGAMRGHFSGQHGAAPKSPGSHAASLKPESIEVARHHCSGAAAAASL